MSTERFMSRIGKHPGRFIFAILAGVLLTLQCLLPSAASARSREPAAPFSFDAASNANYIRDKVGVSVVRLVATYVSPEGNPLANTSCTGLGVLIGSEPFQGAYQNWVLTSGGLVSSSLADCGLAGSNEHLESLQVLASDIYTQKSQNVSTSDALLVQMGCTLTLENSAVCVDKNHPTLPEDVSSVSANPGSYTLFAFPTSVSQPYLTPNAASTSQQLSQVNLINPARGIFLPTKVAPAVFSELPNYLVPSVVSASQSAGNPVSLTPLATRDVLPSVAPSTASEPGTPIVDEHGELVSIALGGSITLNLSTIRAALNEKNLLAGVAVPPVSSPCPSVTACWNPGIDAFYASPPQYQRAQQYLSKISAMRPANTQFRAPAAFAMLASQALRTSGQSASTTSSSSSTSSWLLLVALGAGLILLVLLLILVTMLVGRAHRRRRELARFAEEQAEAERIAAAEIQRQRAQKAEGPEMPCPNCHKPVHLGDAMCPYCRFPLSPTASGLNVRLAGNAPVPAASLSISDQPTVQFSDQPTVPFSQGNGEGETTAKRQPAAAQEESVYNVQQMRGRNLSLAVGTRSDPGIKRKHKPNEDSLFAMQGARTHNSRPQQFGLFVVADGMGGHANGQDASRLAIQTMIDFMLPKVSTSEQMDDNAFLKLLSDGVQNANMAVHNRNMEARADMGTTMTTALVVGSTAYIANVGDSRTYLYREGQGLTKVTNDHSVVASLVEAGIIKPDDIYTHPKRNQIYRSLGEKPMVEVDTFKVDLQAGDKLLLCSDGLWDMTRDPVIQQIMSKPTGDPNKTSQELIKAALEGGGEDNVTVIVVQFSEMNERTGMTGVQLLAKPETVTVPNLPQM
jgi:serine/threonine protein phosphatase PrpC/Na+-transporting methylmalonyl-CoA/oxaloacetate decarboxylase gamma subunit